MSAEQPQSTFKWIEGKDYAPEIYTNYVQASCTLFDVRFQLGQMIPVGEELTEGIRIEKRGAVTVAWPEIKAMRDMLIDLVKRFEAANGEIKPLKLPLSPNEPLLESQAAKWAS